ncbi:MAG TPA: hypothetical protein VHW24_11135 [Bryobacteraceae bacterium]|jgi:hypothetical protein|nr:hypothetical protein [Bryobacteraceae bacterium]
MNGLRKLAVIALGAAPAVALAANWDDWRTWPYNAKETIEKSFDVSKGGDAKKFLVDNMRGYIHVGGGSGSQIHVTVHKEVRARSQSALDEGKREAKLDISQQGNYVRFYDDGPWRNHDRGDDYYGYRVAYDYDVQVPSGTELELKGFNDPIQVKGTTGPFDVHGFNGGVDMEDITGSGNVQTFNGEMKVSFRSNPDHDCNFKTFNGSIDAYFKPDFNADLHFKTFHGGVYSDFDVAPLPATVTAGHNLSAKYVYRSDGGGGARVGKGGAALRFEGFNGSIRLHTK